MRYSIPLVLVAGALALAGCGGKSSGSKATTAAATPVTITVEVEGGKPVGGIQRATAKKGQEVAIVVHSDVADEVHVHGYDLHKDVAAGGTVRIRFVANIQGEFEAELESRKLQIVALTVK